MPLKQPERTCIVCRKKCDKSNLIKIIKNKNGEIKLDFEHKLGGRGAYICKNAVCIEKCIKAKAINRVFKTNIEECIYEELKNVIQSKN